MRLLMLIFLCLFLRNCGEMYEFLVLCEGFEEMHLSFGPSSVFLDIVSKDLVLEKLVSLGSLL